MSKLHALYKSLLIPLVKILIFPDFWVEFL